MSAPFPIGVCSWSIDRFNPLRAMETAALQLDLRTVHLGFFTDDVIQKADSQALAGAVAEHKLTICGTFVAFDREDYSSIDAIARTGGLTPDDEYAHRLDTFRLAAALTAHVCGVTGIASDRRIAIHAGTVPSQPADPTFVKLVTRVREFADVCAAHNLRLLLETGRESAQTLAAFIAALQRQNVGVNFDPANFVIYGADEPVKALAGLKPLIQLVHLKDAVRAADGKRTTFGSAAAFGQGEVHIPRVVSKLRAAGYSGPLLIETPQRAGLTAIREAAAFLRSMF